MVIRKICMFLMILMMAALSVTAAENNYVFVVDDQGPADDVMTVVDAMKHFNLNTETAKLNSEVTRADLKDKVTTFVYQGDAVIFFEDNINRDDYTFASDLSIYLKQEGISASFKSVQDVSIDDLKQSLPGYQTNQQCMDSDGRNYYTRGTNEFAGSSTVEICVWNDGKPTNGEEGTKVIETWCENGDKKEEIVSCDNGCIAGACVNLPDDNQPITHPVCKDSDNGKDYGVKGITQGIGEFISDPNYDGGVAERTDYCDEDVLVEYFCRDSTRMGYIRKTCEHGCGNGICFGASIPAPVPAPTPIVEPPQCRGCESQGYCIPTGSRIMANGKPAYCSFDNQLKEQKQLSEECQNNFECASNQCSNGTCISLQEELRETKGMLQKILDWLGRIFG